MGSQYPKSQGEAASHLGSSALATRYNQGPMVPNNIRQSLGLLPVPSGARATRRPSFDAALWVLLASWLLPHFDDRTPAPPPSALPPFSRPRPLASGAFETVSLVIATSQILSSTCDWSDLAETPTSSLVLDSCLFPGLAVTLAQRVLPPWLASSRSQRLPYFQRPPGSVFLMFLIRVLSLFANGLFCLAVSHLLAPQAGCAVMFSISLVFLIFWIIFVTLLYFLGSRVTFVVIFSVFHIFFIFRVFLYKVSLRSLGPLRHFCYLLCFSFSPYIPTFSTEDDRCPKSQGGVTGRSALHPRPPNNPGEWPCSCAKDRHHCTPDPARALPERLEDIPSTLVVMPAHLSSPKVFVSSAPLAPSSSMFPMSRETVPIAQEPVLESHRINEMASLAIATHQFLPNPKSQVADIGLYQFPRICSQSDFAELSGARPLRHGGANDLGLLNVTTFSVVPCRLPFVAPSYVLDVCFFQNIATAPDWRVVSPFVSLAWSHRLPHFHQSPIPGPSLLLTRFFSCLANSPFGCMYFRPLVSRVTCTAMFLFSLVCLVFRLCPDKYPSFSLTSRVCFLPCVFSHSVLSRFHQQFFSGCCVSRRCLLVSFSLGSTRSFGSVFLFGPAFLFCLAFSFSFAWLWSRVFDQGWSSSEVPRRGSQPLGLVSQTHESTTHLSPALHKFPSPTPHPTACTLAINPDWFRQAKFAKRSCCGYIGPNRDRPQCLDHGSILPSPGRPCIFRSSSVNTCGAGVPQLEPYVSRVEMMMAQVAKDSRSLTTVSRTSGTREKWPTRIPPPEEKPLGHDRILSRSRVPGIRKAFTNQGWLESEVPRR